MGTQPKSNKTSLRRTVFVASGLGISLLMMASCGGASMTPHQLVAIAVSPTGAGANVGDTVPFTATGTFAQAPTTQPNLPAQWTSSDTRTATVNPSTGAATCVGIGDVTITASAAGMAGTLTSTGALTCAAPGTGPVKLVPNSLIFSCQYIATENRCACSPPEGVTLTNSLSTSLTIDGITASGAGFSASPNTCGASVGPGHSCAIAVRWSPTAMTGPTGIDGLVTITDSDSTSPQAVRLTGIANKCAP